jgi:ABC-type phosphate/phosphonate transport system ATPase subunit
MKKKPKDDVVIELRNVWRTYEMGDTQVHALRGINLKVRTGEFVAIMGPSGSGKCVPAETMIFTPTGLHRIDDLVKKPQSVIGFDGAFQEQQVSHTYSRKTNELIEIITRTGKKIQVTPSILSSPLTNMDIRKYWLKISRKERSLPHLG